MKKTLSRLIINTLLVLSIIFGSTLFIHAQKYHFINLNVADGLPQSQAHSLIQDNFGQLYVGTYGGIGIYDGVSFKRLDKTDGLLSNYVNHIAKSSKEDFYIAHLNGITKISNNRKEQFPLPSNSKFIYQLIIDQEDRVWVIIDHQLYLFDEENYIPFEKILQKKNITSNAENPILSLGLDLDGSLLIANYYEEILKWDGEHLNAVFKNKDGHSFIQIISLTQKQKTYLVGLKHVFELNTHYESKKISTPTLKSEEYITSFFMDRNENYWLATNLGGVYYAYGGEQWQYFNFSNGFTSEQILSIYEDNEGSIWFSSDGSGIFRFKNQSLTYYDEYTAGFNPNVLAISEDKNDAIILAVSNGLFKLNQDGKAQELLYKNQQIKSLSLIKKEDGLLYIGTLIHGLLVWDGQQLKGVFPQQRGTVSSLFIHNSTLFFNYFNQLHQYNNNQVKSLNFPYNILSTLSLDEDHLLISTLNGIYNYDFIEDTFFVYPEFQDHNIIDIIQHKDHIFLGSLEDGLYIVDKKTKETKLLTTQQGLSCNSVYSLLIDSQEQLWIGTGCGIDLISLKEDKFTIRKMSNYFGLGHIEANSKALYEDKNGEIWIGTNNKLFRFNPDKDFISDKEVLPPLLFESVLLFSKDISASELKMSAIPFTDLPDHPIFRTNENHLTFNFKAVSLSQANNITYRYQLIGVDKDYTETKQTTVIYPNLSPGTYTFKVWASNAEGVFSTEYAIEFPFTINAPYWQSLYFWIGLLMLSIALTFGIMYYRNRWKQERLIWAQQLREEAQDKVRQNTAEDFHDEIGNKLTRIKLLSSIAKIQVTKENQQAQDVLQQIIDNVQQLFAGSKDIIWSLQPESNYLDEVVWKIHQNAENLVDNSPIQFEAIEDNTGKSWNVLLPMQWGRNILMIFKEGLTNAVRHSNADHITFHIYDDEQAIMLSLKDNGKGISEHKSKGNGLKNMHNRAERIGCELLINSNGEGTEILLKLWKSKLRGK